ncbi:MAG: hypothetical protein PVH99_20380, partial [Desulfobacteraceae bacterium]
SGQAKVRRHEKEFFDTGFALRNTRIPRKLKRCNLQDRWKPRYLRLVEPTGRRARGSQCTAL